MLKSCCFVKEDKESQNVFLIVLAHMFLMDQLNHIFYLLQSANELKLTFSPYDTL